MNRAQSASLVVLALIGWNWAKSESCITVSENELPALFCSSSVSSLPIQDSAMIPPQLAKLRILGRSSSGLKHNGRLSQYNLTGLESLIYLEISDFQLEFIQTDTFRMMRVLRVLDLSRNRITTIQPGAFNGLTLNLLSLTDNSGLILTRGVFRGSHVQNIAARNCGLRELDYETVAEAKSKRLGLSHNQITSLDQRFEMLIKPWLYSTPINPTDMDDWGFIDLTNNPLSCDCKLIWLPKVIEEQLYAAQRSVGKSIKANDGGHNGKPPASLNEQGDKRMYQLNLTCGSPSNLMDKPLPESWSFFCPKPSVVGIDVHLLTEQADQVQLTCTGRGQPPPNLAWTYRINGHKVQKTLDSSTPHITGGRTFDQNDYNRYPMAVRLHERSIALNVSLKESVAKNFTCTAWNNDDPRSQGESYPFDMTDRFKSVGPDSQVGPHMITAENNVRMHEVTIRIYNQPKLLNQATGSSLLAPTKNVEEYVYATNYTALTSLVPITEAVIEVTTSPGPYDYLFIERFSLLQLLGAVFGTFIVTLALLYAVTHFLSCFCHVPQLSLRDFHRSPMNEKRKKRWLGFDRHNDSLLFSQTQRTDLPTRGSSDQTTNETTLAKTTNFDSAFSLLTSGSNVWSSTPGPSTVSVRKHNIPQALHLTNVPAPPAEQRTSTPPPNPAYWPMPEYTYTGTGSHEYDVPRPLEPFFNCNPTLQQNTTVDGHFLANGTAPSFLSLTNHALLPSIPPIQYTDKRIGQNPLLFQSSNTLSPFPNQWPASINPGGNVCGSLMTWGQPTANPPTGMLAKVDRQLPCITYAPYPSVQSAVYSADYPAYLQTRPYPHHPNSGQPLFDLVAHTKSAPVYNQDEDETMDKEDSFSRNPESIAQTSSSHTSETGLLAQEKTT